MCTHIKDLIETENYFKIIRYIAKKEWLDGADIIAELSSYIMSLLQSGKSSGKLKSEPFPV